MPEELIQFTELPALAANAGAILTANRSMHDRALAKAQTLLDTIEGEGMTDELDAECNKFLGQCARAIEIMNGKRAPITKLFTAIAKEFTTLENPFDKTKDGTFAFKVQAQRNNYARQKQEEIRRKQMELERKRMADQERIDIKARVETIVREKYNGILFGFKKKYNDLFNSINLENILDIGLEIDAAPVHYPHDKFLQISCPVTSNYMPADELAGVIFDAREGLYKELNANFTAEMQALKMHLTDQIPSRKFELEEIERAGAKEKKRLKEEADLRQRQEELRLEQERADKEKEAATTVELAKSVLQAELTFDQELATAQLHQDAAPVKQSYNIVVYTPVGWQQIAALWISEFANKTPVDKFEKKTFGSMKADLEKLAFNGGKKLDNSTHLVYEVEVKAITKKV